MNLYIRADANSKIGIGHIMRCLALAQAWQDKGGKVTFISHCESNILKQRLLDEDMNFISIEKEYPAPSDLERTLGNLSTINHNQPTKCWLVVDGYHFDTIYQRRMKEVGYKILWIDDYGHADYYCADIVLNQNISADKSFYRHREPYTQLLLGTRYVLLRREFKRWQGWKRDIDDIAHKVLVTMGGADPDNVTLKVIQALGHVDISGLEIKIVAGPANPNQAMLEKQIAGLANLQLINNPAQISALMAWADIAISAGGSTCWELASMGLPSIILVLADNQNEIAKGLHDSGSAINLKWHSNISDTQLTAEILRLLNSKQQRLNMHQACLKLVDGNGSQRIIDKMQDGFAGKRNADK